MSIKNYLKTKKLKIKKFAIISIIFSCLFLANHVRAEDTVVDYKEGIVVDSDLDGLTDEGEKQIYGTDSKKADSDGDGYLDGAEVLSGTDPVDGNFYPGRIDFSGAEELLDQETPWAWYVSRATGLLAFVFLWLTILLGLSIRNPILKKIIEPIYSFDFHVFIAEAAIFWTLIHGTSLLFDKFIGFGVKDVAVPYFSQSASIDTNHLALGIMAFYMMVIMTVTSYLRSHLNFWVWRILHFLHPVAFIFIVIHGYRLGTDMKNTWIAGAFLFSSALLVLIYFSSLVFVITNKIRSSSAKSDRYE